VVAVSGQPLRLRFTNRDDSAPAFGRTPSFNVVYICGRDDRQLDSPTTATLTWTVARLARFDPGALALTHPPRVRPRGLALPVVANELLERAWHRDLFDRSMEGLLARQARASNLIVVVAQACEMNCGFCPTADRVDIHRRPSGEDGQYDDLVHQIRRGGELGARVIDFGGNDVLRFPGIVGLFDEAGRAGYTRIMAQSPGHVLADRAFAEAVAASALTHVCLPIYGATAAVHDAVTRTPGSFDRLVRALDNVRALGRPAVELHTIALKSTLPHLEGLIDFARERFGLALRVATLRSNRQGERSVVLDMASFTDLKPIIGRFPEHFRAEFPPCVMPRDLPREKAAPSPEGDPLPPINLYDLGLPAGCEDARVAEERVLVQAPPCARCEARSECRGVLGHYLDMFGDGELVPLGPAAQG